MNVTLNSKGHKPVALIYRIGIWSVDFCGGRKTREPGEKPSVQGQEPTAKLNPHVRLWFPQKISTLFLFVHKRFLLKFLDGYFGQHKSLISFQLTLNSPQ